MSPAMAVLIMMLAGMPDVVLPVAAPWSPGSAQPPVSVAAPSPLTASTPGPHAPLDTARPPTPADRGGSPPDDGTDSDSDSDSDSDADGRTAASAAATADLHSRTRATFLLQVLRCARWPEDRFADAGSHVVVGVPRGSASVQYVAAAFRQRLVGRRTVIVRELDLVAPSPESVAAAIDVAADAARLEATIATCHAVYLPSSQADPAVVRRAATVARRASVLLLAADRAALDHGAAVAFPLQDDAVKLMVHRAALDATRVALGARLLKLATIVDPEPAP